MFKRLDYDLEGFNRDDGRVGRDSRIHRNRVEDQVISSSSSATIVFENSNLSKSQASYQVVEDFIHIF